MAAIEVRDLCRTYRTHVGIVRRRRTDVQALGGISFEVGRGELFGLLGPNGAGKTTTIKILTTLLLPSSGSARVLGFDPAREPGEVRRRVGHVFGGDRGLYDRLSALDNLRYFADLYRVPVREKRARIDSLLELVGLEGRERERVVEADVNSLRVFFVGGVTSYRALFNWVNPWVFVPQTLGYPIFEILFFSYLGRFANVQSDKFFLIGNAFMAIAMTGLFGMGNAIAGERRSQTLATLLASPANRLALFLGRAVPSVLTGLVVSATAFSVCRVILGVHFRPSELAGLAVAALVSSFACTSFGLCLGGLGLRGRSVSLFADMIGGSMLLLSGANVPFDRLPGAVQAVGRLLPLTHGIAAGRELGSGASLRAVSGLLGTEALVGGTYLAIGIVMLRVLEFEGRRAATLETF